MRLAGADGVAGLQLQHYALPRRPRNARINQTRGLRERQPHCTPPLHRPLVRQQRGQERMGRLGLAGRIPLDARAARPAGEGDGHHLRLPRHHKQHQLDQHPCASRKRLRPNAQALHHHLTALRLGPSRMHHPRRQPLLGRMVGRAAIRNVQGKDGPLYVRIRIPKLSADFQHCAILPHRTAQHRFSHSAQPPEARSRPRNHRQGDATLLRFRQPHPIAHGLRLRQPAAAGLGHRLRHPLPHRRPALRRHTLLATQRQLACSQLVLNRLLRQLEGATLPRKSVV